MEFLKFSVVRRLFLCFVILVSSVTASEFQPLFDEEQINHLYPNEYSLSSLPDHSEYGTSTPISHRAFAKIWVRISRTNETNASHFSLFSLDTVSLSTVFSCTHDGDVHAWQRSTGMVRWSFSSGPPLASFKWVSDETLSNAENATIGIGEELGGGGWTVHEPALFAEADGTFIVWDPSKGSEKLKLTLADLRTSSVHMRDGEIVMIDRTTTVFLVDADTGQLIGKLGADSLRDVNMTEDGKSLFVVRTDYSARASNMSGALLWSFTYGELGTFSGSYGGRKENVPTFALLPTSEIPEPGQPLVMISPPADVGNLLQLPQMAIPERSTLVSNKQTSLAISSTAAPSLAPAVIWEDSRNSNIDSIVPAPGPIYPPRPPMTNFGMLLTTALGGLAMLLTIRWYKTNLSSKQVPDKPGSTKRKKTKKASSRQDIPLSFAGQNNAGFEDEHNVTHSLTRVKRRTNNYGSGVQVGRLFVTDRVIGAGSNGTLVLEGCLDDRKVAIKRLLTQFYEKAEKEIALLIASDEHPNVVRYYWMEETTDFVYVALERCSFSLHDLIHTRGPKRSDTSNDTREAAARKFAVSDNMQGFHLWDHSGRPTAQLFKVMKDVIAGLAHLHVLGIVHRDLKPHNVLISGGLIVQAKIADMGLSKRLDEDASSYDAQLTGHGSSGSRGWQAPEQLLKGRGSRAVDIFSLGCVLFHCITSGHHPFGAHIDRDWNIVHGLMDLFPIVDFPEAKDLIERLLHRDPARRPPAQDILFHPFFWNSEQRLAFLRDASDRVEIEVKGEKNPCTKLFNAVESLEAHVFGGGGSWDGKVDFVLLQNVRAQRHYKYRSVRDLLRVIRNKANHFNELPQHLQELLGPGLDGLEKYFTSRFPHLLIELYQVIVWHCRGEPFMERYIPGSYESRFPYMSTDLNNNTDLNSNAYT